ncbi:MAG: hypothetical protein CMH22_09250 [Methylophaga sp.]|nr:VPLPA-CTERM sorting domain-containing protein [Methylophaga sp. UBA678]MAX52156.1 hypothetical protein [Methylophaga sp.]|tara:strand:+ start:11219 stop:11881 length:663 start_codon:yes stop_codon:yes gene_type:complete
MKAKHLLSGLLALGLSHAVSAGTIIGAKSVTSKTQSSVNNNPYTTINQSGLHATYTSGTTDFDSFTATTKHSYLAHQKEWFSKSGNKTDTLIYDLGALYSVDKIAIWNEESIGTKTVSISYATDSLFSDEVSLGTFSLTKNLLNQDYLADVLSFNFVTAQFFKFDVTGNSVFMTSLGEVAFSNLESGAPGVSEVPIPAAAFLFGPAILGMVGLRRKSKQA